MTIFGQMKHAMEEPKVGTFGYFTVRQKTLSEWLTWVDDYSSMLCASYKFVCEDCGCTYHINYQCKSSYDTALASYNREEFKLFVDVEVLELVLITAFDELIARMKDIKKKSKALDRIYEAVLPMHAYCYKNFIHNALVLTTRQRVLPTLERRNRL